MGRPKGSKNVNKSVNRNVNNKANGGANSGTNSGTNSRASKKAEKEKGLLCPKCGRYSKTDLISVDTNYVSRVSDYHREHPRVVRVCLECCHELSDVIDSWLSNYPKKAWYGGPDVNKGDKDGEKDGEDIDEDGENKGG